MAEGERGSCWQEGNALLRTVHDTAKAGQAYRQIDGGEESDLVIRFLESCCRRLEAMCMERSE